MQFKSKFNKEIRFLLCFTDIYGKYAWLIPLKDKRGTAIANSFQKNLKESNCKPTKICLDKGS